jgi:4-aminobutyrate aminotransferase-like enzyme
MEGGMIMQTVPTKTPTTETPTVVASQFVTKARSEAAHAIAEVTPGDLNRVFFSTGGTEANEAAIKMAHDLTGRPLICARYRSYHGSTYGSMSHREAVHDCAGRG